MLKRILSTIFRETEARNLTNSKYDPDNFIFFIPLAESYSQFIAFHPLSVIVLFGYQEIQTRMDKILDP